MSTHNSESSTGNSSSHELSLQPRKRAKVWEHFEQELVMVDGVPKAQCKYCRLMLTATRKSGTSHLINHVCDSCPLVEVEVRNRFIAIARKQPVENFVFYPRRSEELMIKFFIHDEIPFRKIEDPYFAEWMESMQPTFKVVGRQTIRDKIYTCYIRMKQELHDELQNIDSRVCLTSDMWTSNQNLRYMVVTAHYIDAEFSLKKKIISLKPVKYPHTSFAIEEAMMRCLTDWGLRGKLFTLTLDNASNNTAACEEMVKNQKNELLFEGRHFHVRCCAHILNLLVQDGMRLIRGAIHKIHELLKYIENSASRIQAFNSIANSSCLCSKFGLTVDVPNRWNTTFKMVLEALVYRAVLNSYANENGEVAPSDEEWLTAESICEFLKAFEEATRLVSADRKPTAHSFLHLVLCIRHALSDFDSQTTSILTQLASAMHMKFAKYWDEKLPNNFNLALVISTVLDPRRKRDYLEFFYAKVSPNMNEAETKVDSVIEWMKSYFRVYEGIARRRGVSCLSHSGQGEASGVGSPVLGKRKLDQEFAIFKSNRTRLHKSEIETYLEEVCEDDSKDFDVLAWWKRNAKRFPVLAIMTWDFLAIPLSIVPSESAFSCGGRILGDTRSSLTPDMLEALVCAKDWLFKPKKQGN
ncbi:Os03g0563400 [Oryza sativa Japonica Group]|uniref:Os03g0563400 protein n=1 Tax=Oryza sativa subsp. japonica TaxID=39947 RepID=A0A0P0VZA9_ORYSJ|nr:Os03g0563400 [Oryza sativa Japonica Group]